MDQFQSTQPIYLQIMERVKSDIVAKHLISMQQLPTVRDLALQYQVNPNTVQRAYSELERLGLVKSDRTIGRFVTDDLGLINHLKHEMIKEKVNHLVKDLKHLNVNQDEAVDFVIKAFNQKGETHD